MTEFTFDEMFLIEAVKISAFDYHYHRILVDVSQGAFTQQTIDEMLAMAPDIKQEYPGFANHITALCADLAALGQISAAPAPFTVDETAKMNYLLAHNTAYPDVTALIHGAEHVGFWTDQQLAKLEAHAYHGHGSQVAVIGLIDDLTAGSQILHHG